jgi:fused signal recognition particle receptor
MGFFSSLRRFLGASRQDVAIRLGTSDPDGSGTQASFSPEEAAMLVELRSCEARLSAWLDVILKGVDGAGEQLYSRIRFLLVVLETPEEEREKFVRTFRSWLEAMEYESLEDFRSELQYRLALALDLEDEEDERSRLLFKLTLGLSATRERLSRGLNRLFLSGRAVDAAFWEELEETLILADTGAETARKLTEKLRGRAATEGVTDAAQLREALRGELLKVFKPARRISAVNPPEVVLVIGVNGAGKTTTVAKLCHREALRGKKILLAAADTFRAAAVEQLEIWAGRAGADFYAGKPGADPAAVTYEALQKGLREGHDIIFADTAGRLHTKTNLMDELSKICRAAGKAHLGAPHRTVLILDAGAGLNALNQIRTFRQCCGIDELILTKLDGTAKGGTAIAAAAFGIPISFIGVGEKMEDLRPFDPESFVSSLLAQQF